MFYYSLSYRPTGSTGESTMNYGMSYQPRKPTQQLWAVGEQVKVGFLSLRIVAKTARGWRLINKDATKRYEFEPHRGLFAVAYPMVAA